MFSLLIPWEKKELIFFPDILGRRSFNHKLASCVCGCHLSKPFGFQLAFFID